MTSATVSVLSVLLFAHALGRPFIAVAAPFPEEAVVPSASEAPTEQVRSGETVDGVAKKDGSGAESVLDLFNSWSSADGDGEDSHAAKASEGDEKYENIQAVIT
jgi:hypothetical protein